MELKQRRARANPLGAAEEDEEKLPAPPEIENALKAAEQAQANAFALSTEEKRKEAAKKGWQTRRHRLQHPDEYDRICICGKLECNIGAFRWKRKNGAETTPRQG